MWNNLGFRVAYNGTGFSGFQLQSKGRSIQAELERCLKTIFKREIRIQFTSRTDAGVHAYDQWIIVKDGFQLFDSLSDSLKKRFLFSLNALLGGRICVWQILKIHSKFNPKTSIEWKEYEYQIHQGPVCDPISQIQAWWIRSPLDIQAMKRAQRLLVGYHDFAGFSKKPRPTDKKQKIVRTTKRQILKADFKFKPHPQILVCNQISFRFRATGYLHHMVRSMVGTLIEIGRGRPLQMERILSTGDRQLSGINAPPGPLRLMKTKVNPKFFKVISSF